MSKRTLTKRQLVFYNVFLPVLVVVICAVVLFGLYISETGLYISEASNGELLVILAWVLAIGALLFALAGYNTAMKTVRFIKKQESFLGISFDDEMRKHQFTHAGFYNKTWYVVRWKSGEEVLVMHADFIKYASEKYYIGIGELVLGGRGAREADRWGITVIYADGNERTFEGDYEVISDLERWLRRAAGSAEETKEDTKKVSTAKKKPVRCIGCRAIVSSNIKSCPYCRSPLE